MCPKITKLNEEEEICVMIRALKKRRNDVAHCCPNVDNWTLCSFQKELSEEFENLLEKLAPIQNISESEMKFELKNVLDHLNRVVHDVQNQQEVVMIMKKEIEEKFKSDLQLRFEGDYDPEDARSGSLKNFIHPKFEQKDKTLHYDDIGVLGEI